tara:strand:- start:171 stop:773 length:603 start_codon:yes stop_codon:yes gene_type:complete
MLNKGAMFGLDARIALAIFGALSVISGAALYSAIQESQTVKFYTQTQEYVKATEAYFLDTGSYLPKNADGIRLYSGNLVENKASADNWNGPYIAADFVESTGLYFNTRPLGNIISVYIFLFTDDEWAGGTRTTCSAGDTNCYMWILYHAQGSNYQPFKDMFAKLDPKFDNNDGPNLGDIRYGDYGGSNSHFWVKAFPYKI